MTEINKNQAENTENSAEKEVLTTSKKDKSSNTAKLVKEEKVENKTTESKNDPKPKLEVEMPNTSAHPNSASYAPVQTKRSGFGLSLLAITMVVALGGATYHFGLLESNKLNAQIDSLNGQIASLKNELQQSDANYKAIFAKAKEDRSRLQILIDQQTNSLSGMQTALVELKGRRPNDWLLAEADHLVKHAGRQLWIEKDIVTSIRLLETADQRIAQLNDPSLTPIRQAMANDLQTLKSIERVDSDGIVLRISSLQNQVNQLVLANALLAEEIEELAPKVVSEEISNWKENLTTSLKEFASEFITYRKREGTVVPLLTPAQTFYLQENVKAKLAQAINATYRENTELYLSSLATAKQWIKDFYHLELPETQGFINSIEELEKQTIKVSYPSQLTSLSLIDNELSLRLSKELATLVRTEVNND